MENAFTRLSLLSLGRRRSGRPARRFASRRLITSVALGATFASISGAQEAPANIHRAIDAKTFLSAISLTKDQQKLIGRNSFVAWPTDDQSMDEVYANNDYLNLPSFVTTDLTLHLYHVIFDATLRTVEQKRLEPILRRLTTTMYWVTYDDYRVRAKGANKQAALRNLGYFAVAGKLLGLKFDVPAPASTWVDAEVARIEAHSGYLAGSIFPYKVDYSQFVPRGHYTRTQQLTRYFKAMMWYGLVPFAFFNEDGSARPNEVRMAVVLADDLFRTKQAPAWFGVYEPTTLYAGESNNLTPMAMHRAMAPIYGAGPTSADLADSGKLVRMIHALRAMPGAKIVSKKLKTGGAAGSIEMKFMGQRDIPDSEALQALTGNERPLPSGLDVMAVLGSHRAASMLDADPKRYNPKGWSNYVPLRNQWRQKFEDLPPASWNRNLYWGWLYAMKAQLQPAADAAPAAMHTGAWTDMRLSTALASWAELRHDTILYGSQSGAEMGDGDEPPPPFVKGYVEPNLPFYDRIISLAKMTRSGLVKRGLIDAGMRGQIDKFVDLCGFLRGCSRLELAHRKLSKDAYLRIRHIEGESGSINTEMIRAGVEYNTLTPEDWDMALVADVHTAGTFALEVATGHADQVAVLVPVEGKPTLARGAVMSFYEFLQPISKRLDDHAWKQLLYSGTAQRRPSWIRSYWTPKAPKIKD